LFIQPAGGGNVHLNDFSPSNTYDWEEVWTPDPNNWTPEQVETKRVTLTLEGSKKDNILIDGAPANIVWTELAECCSCRRRGRNRNRLSDCYRAGWQLNRAALFSNVTVAVLLIPLGMILFREEISLRMIAGSSLYIIMGLILLIR
jgi:hypothetical protein